MSEREQLEPKDGDALMSLQPQKLRNVKPSELAIRFVFGASVSIVASVNAQLFGAAVGGMFLAFPAILPATLTLLEQKHGTEDAAHDDRGAVLGGVGLLAFAVTAALLFTRTPAPMVLVAASVAWLVASFALYLAVAVNQRSSTTFAPKWSLGGGGGRRVRRSAAGGEKGWRERPAARRAEGPAVD